MNESPKNGVSADLMLESARTLSSIGNNLEDHSEAAVAAFNVLGANAPHVLQRVMSQWDVATAQKIAHAVLECNADVDCNMFIEYLPHKDVLLNDDDIEMDVALIGEYRQDHWADALQKHWPQIVLNRVETALSFFEEVIEQEQEIHKKFKMPFSVSVIQEKVLLTYSDMISDTQFQRYLDANQKYQRTPSGEFSDELVARHLRNKINQALPTEPQPHVRILKL